MQTGLGRRIIADHHHPYVWVPWSSGQGPFGAFIGHGLKGRGTQSC